MMEGLDELEYYEFMDLLESNNVSFDEDYHNIEGTDHICLKVTPLVSGYCTRYFEEECGTQLTSENV